MPLYLTYPTWIQPQIIPGLPFQWYGMMYLVAFGLSYLLMRVQVRERRLELPEGQLSDFFFWGILGLLIGARLFATLVFEESGFYWRNPHRIVWPFDESGRFVGIQGMNFYGGLLGAVAGFWLFSRRTRVPLLEWGDMLVAGVPLGYTFGRLGNFINGELYGRVTTVSWGVVFPYAERFRAGETWVQEIAAEIGMTLPDDPAALVNLPRHPTQIYEALTEGVLAWVVIWFFVRKRNPFPGFIVAFYVLWYGAWRFLIDYFRMPIGSDYFIRLASDPSIPPYRLLTPWNFILSQVWSFAMIVAGAALLVIFYRVHRRGNASGVTAAGATAGAGAAPRSTARKVRKKISKAGR